MSPGRPTHRLRRRLAGTLLILVLAASELPLGASYSGDADLKNWVQGPIRYIATKEEAKAYKALETDEDRAYFVERFWRRRDPSPDTLVNEYRELFWRRVKEANDTIQDSPKPGWKTDRGKVYILYGAPTEIQSHPNLATDSGPTSGRGLIRWIYQGRPGERMDMDPITVVPFARDLTGEYRLSYDPKLSSVFFDELAIREGRRQKWDDFFTNIGAPPIESTLSVMLDLGKMQEIPPHEQVLIESVETLESFATEPLAAQVERFRHPDEDGTLTAVTIHLPKSRESSRPAILARFSRRGVASEPVILGEGSFRILPGDSGGLIAQGRTNLPAGNWDLLVVAADPDTGTTGIHRGTVSTRDRTDELRLSDVILASRLEPVAVSALASHDEPFHLGSFRVVPRSGATLPRGDALRLFYEIYGGEGPYHVTYRIQGRENDGRWIALGRPAEIEEALSAQGWEVPIGPTWPEGEYRVMIEIRDVTGARASARLPFRVRSPGS